MISCKRMMSRRDVTAIARPAAAATLTSVASRKLTSWESVELSSESKTSSDSGFLNSNDELKYSFHKFHVVETGLNWRR